MIGNTNALTIIQSGGYEVESINNGDGTQTLQINDNGGSSTPTTLSELGTALNSLGNNIYREIFKAPTNTVEPVYNTPKILYTPAATHTKYSIRQRYDLSGWNIIWVESNFEEIAKLDSNYYTCKNNYIDMSNQNIYKVNNFACSAKAFSYSNPSNVNSYVSQLFSTLQEAIDGIQSQSTTYTSANGTYFNQNVVPISNLPFTRMKDQVGSSGTVTIGLDIEAYPLTNLQRISNDETIEVIV